MPEQAIHPSRGELQSYGLGQLSPDDATDVERHISECGACCEAIADLSYSDTFVQLLQEAEQLPTDQEVDHNGVPIKPSLSWQDIPVPLTEHPRYEIVGLVGRGGMGDVYEARHRKMERAVALKVINSEVVRNIEAVDRFHREVKTAAKLSHPNIVTAHDADNAGDYHFMVMEYVDGVDLSRIIKDRRALPITEACDYIRQAAIGLDYAHEQGMVHRDIKPHNLMVAADGTVKILDFGLAALAPEVVSTADTAELRSELTAAGAIMGTPGYISPEQAEDARYADTRSDIYSLGATLYHLLSGRAAFDEGSVMHTLDSHERVEPVWLETLRDDIPVALGAIVRKMMAKDPDDRFQKPLEVAAALEFFLQSDQAAAESPPAQVQPASRRNRRLPLAAVATSLIIALVAGIGFYLQTSHGTIRGTGKVVAFGPGSTERAVELWISGDDVLLVQEGDSVRLHFEGWPAVLSNGVFGGAVMTIDLTADHAGKFRILVKADGKDPWPDQRYLRPGVRANCWVSTGSILMND